MYDGGTVLLLHLVVTYLMKANQVAWKQVEMVTWLKQPGVKFPRCGWHVSVSVARIVKEQQSSVDVTLKHNIEDKEQFVK